MDDALVPLLDRSGRWTHRDRHQHHHFEIDVPDGTTAIWIRFRWGPLDMGSEHEANGLNLSLFGPEGFRGAAMRGRADQEMTTGTFDATPGFLSGPIQPGSWTIVVDAFEILNDGADSGHLDYRVEARATIGAVGWGQPPPPENAAGTRSVQQALSGPRWFRGDLHSHTVHSDGRITVEDRVRGAVARGQDFLAITDHNTISQAREHDRWPSQITPIRGSEVTTFHGHIMCLGLSKAIDWRDDARGSGAASIVAQAHAQNGLVSINHPNAFGDPWCGACHWDFALVDYSTFDAMEIWNGRWAEPETDNLGALAFWTDLLDAGYRLTAVSGTDSHSAEEDAYPALPLNYVYAPDRSEAAILDGIRRGRVFLSSGPLLSFRARGADGVELTLPGGELPGDGTFDLEATVERLEAPATLWYTTLGSAMPLEEVGPGRTTLAREGLHTSRWWRLELHKGSAITGDLMAITNPVFVSGPAVERNSG